jgi:type III restriction enzyme
MIGDAGVEATEKDGAADITLDDRRVELPDLLTYLQNQTELTRRSLVRILIDSRRLNDFKRNPQQFTEIAAEVINSAKRLLLVGGIKYQRIGDQDYYAQELFETEELTGYLRNLFATSSKSVYEQVVYDADTEARFADQLEKNSSVKIYAKLPGWFTVPTPLGSYNPDWAVLADIGVGERLYLVVETKSSLLFEELRDREGAKIKCGKAHFNALATGDDPARFVTAVTLEDALTSGDDEPVVR